MKLTKRANKKGKKTKKNRRRNKKQTNKHMKSKNKNKKTLKRVKSIKKGGNPNELPKRENYNTTKEFFEAIQEYRRRQAEQLEPESTTNEGEIAELQQCENVEKHNTNEIGEIERAEYVFKFKYANSDDKVYCYSESQMKRSINNISNIQCRWRNKEGIHDNDDISEAERLRRQQGYGKESQINNFPEYIEKIIDDDNELKEYKDERQLFWNSIINMRTWINEEGIKILNDNRGKSGYFILNKQPVQTIIGNIFNVFGMSMIHGHEPGEYIYDITFVPDNTKNTVDKVCSLINKYEIIYKSNLLWNTYFVSSNNISNEDIDASRTDTYNFDDDLSAIYPDDAPSITGQIFENEHESGIEGINLFGDDIDDIEGEELQHRLFDNTRGIVMSPGDNRLISMDYLDLSSDQSNNPMTLSELDTTNIPPPPGFTPPGTP